MRRNPSLLSDADERISPLAKLPVFWNLQGKRAVIAGGSEGAAWKAELLRACGATVEVFSEVEDLSETMAALIARTALIHHAHPWHCGIFTGASLALADCETEDEARAFFCAARAAGVPVNVIDKPAFCQFQFGSIVNRSPVIVSISTDGAAPILAQQPSEIVHGLAVPLVSCTRVPLNSYANECRVTCLVLARAVIVEMRQGIFQVHRWRACPHTTLVGDHAACATTQEKRPGVCA